MCKLAAKAATWAACTATDRVIVAASGSPFHQNRQDLVLQALRVLPGEQGGVGGEDQAFARRLLLCTRCADEGLLETCTFVRLSVRQSLWQPDGVLRQRYGDAKWEADAADDMASCRTPSSEFTAAAPGVCVAIQGGLTARWSYDGRTIRKGMLRTGCSGVGHVVDCAQRHTKRTKVSAAAKLCGGEHWKRKQNLREMDRPAKYLTCAASREVASSHAPASSDSAEIMGRTSERVE